MTLMVERGEDSALPPYCGAPLHHLLFVLVVFLALAGSSFAFICYQESVNVSNQTGIDAGGCGLNYSGNVTNVNGADLYVTYAKPAGAQYGSTWMIKIGNVTSPTNFTLPAACWNADPNIVKMHMFSLLYFYGDTDSYAECYNGTGYEQLSTFHTAGHFCAWSTTYPFANFTFDGNWSTYDYFVAQCAAGEFYWADFGQGNSMPSYAWTNVLFAALWEEAMWWNVSLPPPSAPLVNVSTPFVNHTMVVTGGTNESRNMTYLCAFTDVNTSLLLRNYGTNCSFFVPQAQAHHVLDVGVIAFDGEKNSTPTDVNVTVENTPPVILSAGIVPSPPTFGDNLTINYSCSDIDGDLCNVSVNYDWFRNGVSLGLNTSILSSDNYSLNDTIIGSAQAFDGMNRSDWRNTSTLLVGDITPPVISNQTYPLAALANSGTNIDVVCTDNSGFLMIGSPSVQWIDPNSITVGFLSMNAIGNDTYRRTFIFTTPGVYHDFKFACIDGTGNSIVQNGTHNLTISVAGGGGGGSGVTQGIVVVTGENATLFTVQTDTGASSSALYMYPGQVREQKFIVQSFTQTSQTLAVSCSGSFCPYVTLDKAQVVLAGYGVATVTATLSLPSSAPYGKTLDYTITIADNSQHTAVLPTQVVVSQLSQWYSKFALVVKPGDAGFWFAAGSFNVPKVVLYLVVLLVAEVLAWAVLPKDRRYRDVTTFVFVALGVVVLVMMPILY